LTGIRKREFSGMTRCNQELAGGTPRSTSKYRLVVSGVMMIEEFDDFGPLRSRTATPGRTPEQHATNRSIKAAAIVEGTGMVPRCPAAESPHIVSDAVMESIAMRR
jgi:hypothetical protein